MPRLRASTIGCTDLYQEWIQSFTGQSYGWLGASDAPKKAHNVLFTFAHFVLPFNAIVAVLGGIQCSMRVTGFLGLC